MYVAERRLNPFVRSLAGSRALSALMLPWFRLHPPRGYAVIETTGRRTGRTRRKCVRAIRRGDCVYVVSIPGAAAAWLKNVRANPRVALRMSGGTFRGHVRELPAGAEASEAREAYCTALNLTDYAACAMHRRGRPTRGRIEELHRAWFAQGIPLVVDLELSD